MKEALQQVDKFAALHGRGWRAKLEKFWMRGEPVPDFPLIYGLRNHAAYGPSWLAKYKPETVA